ncbi:hypothetical protein B1H58_10845 [Pantoea alhagi]|uniref:ShlB/FhaC/HecB family hemolysin secretion/activation protein n=1 Tax=Pantoea alhagi TaxID=1891675 RepID=A0A1W6B5V7_9GAMM|nr:ShlB/FhaC/HecB family hemolysin secretion/activation protein [Pantoea alhagi]ARJ42472.1 hypothetical protein B1H58_10845 [Pantoea alhagi]
MIYRLLLLALFILPITSFSGSNSVIIEQQSLHQQELQKARQKSLATTGKAVQGSVTVTDNNMGEFIDSSDCLPIKAVQLENKSDLPVWLPLQRIADRGIGHCLNVPNVRHLVRLLENRIMKAGYITSRISVPDQQAGNGTLRLRIVAGRVGQLALSEGSSDNLYLNAAFPLRSGDLLDLRAVEQGLENMQRIPHTDVAIQLAPGERPGSTDIHIKRQQSRSWRTAFWLDDAGSRYTGRYQAGTAFYLDNPTALNDLFYFSLGRTLEYKKERGSSNYAVWYSVPYGYWLLDFYASENRYSQPLTGELSGYYYSGKSRNLSVQLSRLLHRDATQKTTLSTQISKRQYRYFLSDTELELQQKEITNVRMALAHRRYLQNGVLDATLSLQRNVPWFGNRPTSEMLYNHYQRASRLMMFDLQAWLPFQLTEIQMSYQPRFLLQVSPDKLVTQDRFSIGNRWSVRGFDGENSLTGNSGWFLSNSINLHFPQWNQQLYAGIDYGRIISRADNAEEGKQLAGNVLGLRGQYRGVGYHLFAGTPLWKPAGYQTDNLTLGFNVQWEY